MSQFFRKILFFFPLLEIKVFSALIPLENVYHNQIIAYVGDRVITQFQLELETESFTKGRMLNDEIKKEIHSKILNDIIDREVIIKEFERMKGQLAESYVQKKYEIIQKMNFGDNPLEFRKILRSNGKTIQEYKNEIRRGIIFDCMLEKERNKSMVSPREVEDYYHYHKQEFMQSKQFDMDQIIVKKENKEAIVEIDKCLTSGLSYDEICQMVQKFSVKYMDGVKRNDIVPEIVEIIENMLPNSWNERPIEFGDQVMFIGLRKIQEERLLSLKEAREFIEDKLLNEHFQLSLKNLIDNSKEKCYCVIL